MPTTTSVLTVISFLPAPTVAPSSTSLPSAAATGISGSMIGGIVGGIVGGFSLAAGAMTLWFYRGKKRKRESQRPGERFEMRSDEDIYGGESVLSSPVSANIKWSAFDPVDQTPSGRTRRDRY